MWFHVGADTNASFNSMDGSQGAEYCFSTSIRGKVGRVPQFEGKFLEVCKVEISMSREIGSRV